MIRVTRSSPPAALVRNTAKWCAAVRSAVTPKELQRALSRYNHKDIRRGLEMMFHSKCAYCESKITHVSYAHIEHYRPKSRYPQYAFDWENLLLACGICNSAEYKGDLFPGSSDDGPPVNPCVDDPADHFEFFYDPRAQIASVIPTTSRGGVTESLLGLNRPELLKHRSNAIRRLVCLAAYAPSDPEARELLGEAISDEGEYSAFARTILETSLARRRRGP